MALFYGDILLRGNNPQTGQIAYVVRNCPPGRRPNSLSREKERRFAVEYFQLVGSGYAFFQMVMILVRVVQQDWSLVQEELDYFTCGIMLLLSVGFFAKIF